MACDAASVARAFGGVATMLVYTGSVHVKDRKFDQLGPFANEPFVRQLDYRFIPEIDHGLTSQASQQSFMKQTCDWVLRVVHRDGNPASPAPSASGHAAAQGPRAASSLATKLEHAGS